MPRTAVILPAAGQSSRFRLGQRKKVFAELNGRAVWLRAAEQFVNRDDVVQTLIVVAPDDEEWFREKFRPNLAFLDVDIVTGGASRAESVRNALAQVRDEAEFIAVHDAARPLLTGKWITEVFRAAFECGAAIPAIPVRSTVKRVNADRAIEDTVDRDGLWLAQTPQVFRRELLEQAYASGQADESATDDAQLVDAAGHTVRVIEGWPMNFKITTGHDFRMAEAVIDKLPRDDRPNLLHPFADEDPRSL